MVVIISRQDMVACVLATKMTIRMGCDQNEYQANSSADCGGQKEIKAKRRKWPLKKTYLKNHRNAQMTKWIEKPLTKR